MSIEDRLSTAGEAWRQSQPPVAVEGLPAVRRTPSLWLPLTAAAATVAVAIGATLLVSRDDSSAPVASGVVPYADLEPRESDVPAPDTFLGPTSHPAGIPCRRDQVTAGLTVVAPGRAQLSVGVPVATQCVLTGDLFPAIVQIATAGTTVLATVPQPGAESSKGTPPAHGVLSVGAGVQRRLDLSWEGLCVTPSSRVEVQQLFDDAVPAPVTGESCRADADAKLEVSAFYAPGQPHAPVPLDRKDLTVSLELPPVAVDGDPLDYRVRLRNPTAAAISLSPCPAWSVGRHRTDSNGEMFSGTGGRLNCEAAPPAVPAGGEVVFAMRLDDVDSGLTPRARAAGELEVQWGIAGPALARAAVGYAAPAGPTPTRLESQLPAFATLGRDVDDDGQGDKVTLVTARISTLSVDRAVGADPPTLGIGRLGDYVLQGALPLPGPDGILVARFGTGSDGRTSQLYRLLGGVLQVVHMTDGTPLSLAFSSGRGGLWAGVTCQRPQGLQLVTAIVEAPPEGPAAAAVTVTRQSLSVSGSTATLGEVIRSKPLLVGTHEEAVRSAAQDGSTTCAGLTAAGDGDDVSRPD